MKKLLCFLFVFTIVACGGDIIDIDDDFFECTVDFVQFVDEQNAIVRFETSLGNETNYYYGRYTFTVDGNDYSIGDDLVYIRDFQKTSKGGATFRFEYGDALGPFCKQIFEIAPNGVGPVILPSNPDFVDVLGDMDFDFESFHF